MKHLLCLGSATLALVCLASAALAQDNSGTDSRLGKPKDLNGYFPLTPPTSRLDWDRRRQDLREQVLVANGLWPMPDKTPLKAVIHGKIERDGYTVEMVYFASYPGHYVTGNLYRPRTTQGALPSGKLPAILSPHGHWANGRFYEANDKTIEEQLKQGAEKTREGAKYPLQARCAQLARMGCVVFHYDMVGYADSQQIPHRKGFADPEAELRLQSFMGLQTWNSVRSLDFLLSLPEVDPTRIGVTGASGGGTQTFILGAIDDRPAVAFPAVMVSTAMQGGCVCENCSDLRVGTGNIELAGLFAPRPLGMSGANDWTVAIETKGLPELKKLYRLYSAEDRVMAKAYPQFGHNYNQVSRELMYNWFNKYLKLGQPEPVVERPFVPVPPKELSVWTGQHTLPKDAVDVNGLRRYLSADSDKHLQALLPKDAKGLAEFRRVLGPALRSMICDTLPPYRDVEAFIDASGPKANEFRISRKGAGEKIPLTWLGGAKADAVVIWIHPHGRASLYGDNKELNPAVREVLKKANLVAPDVFGTGDLKAGRQSAINKDYAGFTFGYNRTLLANRVRDILTTVAFVRENGKHKVYLVGLDKAGPWVVLARGLCGDAVERTAADLNGFRFEHLLSMEDEMMLPGALKYGGLPVLAALSAPHELYLHNTKEAGSDRWLRAAYEAAGQPSRLRLAPASSPAIEVVNWLLR